MKRVLVAAFLSCGVVTMIAFATPAKKPPIGSFALNGYKVNPLSTPKAEMSDFERDAEIQVLRVTLKYYLRFWILRYRVQHHDTLWLVNANIYIGRWVGFKPGGWWFPCARIQPDGQLWFLCQKIYAGELWIRDARLKPKGQLFVLRSRLAEAWREAALKKNKGPRPLGVSRKRLQRLRKKNKLPKNSEDAPVKYPFRRLYQRGFMFRSDLDTRRKDDRGLFGISW